MPLHTNNKIKTVTTREYYHKYEVDIWYASEYDYGLPTLTFNYLEDATNYFNKALATLLENADCRRATIKLSLLTSSNSNFERSIGTGIKTCEIREE